MIKKVGILLVLVLVLPLAVFCWVPNLHGTRSLKIEKPTPTADWVGWISGNQAKTYWNNMQSGVLYQIGGYIKTEGVNTSPADSSYEWGLYWEFLDAMGSQIAWQWIPVDQSVATKDWDTLEAFVTLPTEPESVYCVFAAGPNATGTAWADDFILGSDPWTAGFFGGNCETPAGWMEWHSIGDEGIAEYTDEDAYSGTYSAKLEELDALGDEIVFYSIPYACDTSQLYLFSVYTKKVNVNKDPHYLPSNFNSIFDDQRLGVCVGFHGAPINTAWNWLGDNWFYINQVDSSSDWEMTQVVTTSPPNAAGVSVRARYNPFPTGTVYYDDFAVQSIELGPNIIGNSDLEIAEPFWWYTYGTGATLTWATDEANTNVRSLKIEKASTSASPVGWQSGNHAKTYWNNMQSGVLYHIGGYVKTSGVNTSPADSTYELGLYWEFLDAMGARIAEAWIPADQSVASKDWDMLEDYVTLPTEPDSVYCSFIFHENATGTAWADDFILGSDPWTAGFFGGNCETPAGWMEWHSEGDVGLAEYTDEDAHSGTYSAKLEELDLLGDEIVFYSIPYSVSPNTLYHFSVWLKRVNVNKDPHYLPSNFDDIFDDQRFGVCVGFHASPINTAWNWLGDNWFYANQTDSIGDWEKYEVVAMSPADAAGVSVRARFNPFPTGTVYYDDFEVREVTIIGSNLLGNADLETDMPFWFYPFGVGANFIWEDTLSLGVEEEIITSYALLQNYPNPFINETYISYQLPKDTRVNLVIFDMLGRRITTLIDKKQISGSYSVRWDGRDDYGNKVASGVYFYRLSTSDFQATQKMLILR